MRISILNEHMVTNRRLQLVAMAANRRLQLVAMTANRRLQLVALAIWHMQSRLEDDMMVYHLRILRICECTVNR